MLTWTELRQGWVEALFSFKLTISILPVLSARSGISICHNKGLLDTLNSSGSMLSSGIKSSLLSLSIIGSIWPRSLFRLNESFCNKNMTHFSVIKIVWNNTLAVTRLSADNSASAIRMYLPFHFVIAKRHNTSTTERRWVQERLVVWLI